MNVNMIFFESDQQGHQAIELKHKSPYGIYSYSDSRLETVADRTSDRYSVLDRALRHDSISQRLTEKGKRIWKSQGCKKLDVLSSRRFFREAYPALKENAVKRCRQMSLSGRTH